MGVQILRVRAPEANQQQRSDALRCLPHLPEAGVGLLAQLLGMGEPEDCGPRRDGSLGVVADCEPVADGLNGHAGLASPGRQSHDRSMRRLAKTCLQLLADLLLEVLEMAQMEAP